MKLATWNVNSISVRLTQVLTWLSENNVDVLALQETKIIDDLFPAQAFEELGYQVCFSGQKTYNGVAVISRVEPGMHLKDNPHFADESRRFLAVTVGEVRLINLYVPNGQSVGSEKYRYKLAWLKGFTQFLKEEIQRYPKLVVVGDFNIAPTDQDVHDPARWAGCVLVSEAERAAYQELLTLGFVDILRHHSPLEPCYTWWDYRQGAFRRNHGLRIDHVLVSQTLSAQCDKSGVDILPRKGERPSDHAPVWITLT